jgi:hypothetical protein
MPTLIHRRNRESQAGTNPKVICRVSSGWVVLGDVQFLRGYSLLVPDPVVGSLNDLSKPQRETFLYEMSVLGDALLPSPTRTGSTTRSWATASRRCTHMSSRGINPSRKRSGGCRHGFTTGRTRRRSTSNGIGR